MWCLWKSLICCFFTFYITIRCPICCYFTFTCFNSSSSHPLSTRIFQNSIDWVHQSYCSNIRIIGDILRKSVYYILTVSSMEELIISICSLYIRSRWVSSMFSLLWAIICSCKLFKSFLPVTISTWFESSLSFRVFFSTSKSWHFCFSSLFLCLAFWKETPHYPHENYLWLKY